MSVNLLMVDDDGDVLINSAKIAVCKGGSSKVTRNVLHKSPDNCKDSAVPASAGPNPSTITATATVLGTGAYVEELTINCHK